MDSIENRGDRIHISEIDEYLAKGLMALNGEVMELSISKNGEDGFVTVSYKESYDSLPTGDGIDFELSSCECSSLELTDVIDYLGKAVHTSSALEFFDFVLGYFSSLDCVVQFTGNAWKIKTTVSSVA
jgi:hypothetical protein